MEAYLDKLIANIAKEQEPDGYISWKKTDNNQARWFGKDDHGDEGGAPELYLSGHLIEAAVAHYQATGKTNFLDIATKNADLLVKIFGPGKLEKYPSHPEIELALVKLYHATGKKKYLNLSKFLLDVRGPNGSAYIQSDQKIINQNEAKGHAVCAAYLYSGVTDIVGLTGDKGYRKAIDNIWTDVVDKKMYITGGIGAKPSHGLMKINWEGFGDAYELPNMTAYNETCASIANVFWNNRMFLLHGDAKYIDVLERTLYNAVLSGISLSGDRFYYPNPLSSEGQYQRASWYGVPCCPTNIVRFLPQVPGYVYAHRNNDLFVNLFMTNTSTVDLPVGKVKISQNTEYPWQGRVNLRIDPEKQSSFTVRVRIPGWVQRPVPGNLYEYTDNKIVPVTIMLNNKPLNYKIEKGYAVLKRTWTEGDRIVLDFPMEVKKIIANEKVKDNVGKIALQRGPMVYCLEWPDNKDGMVQNIMIDENTSFSAEYRPDFLNGVVELKADGVAYNRNPDNNLLLKSATTYNAIPYYAWANRGPGEMEVWMPETEALATPEPIPPTTIASESRIFSSFPSELLSTINDQYITPYDINVPISNYYRWPLTDNIQWVQYVFKKSEKVSFVKLYWYDNEPSKMTTWYDDVPRTCARVPESWKLYYKDDVGRWIEVKAKGKYLVEKEKYNTLEFDPVETTSLKIEVQRNKECATGILEWSVN